jgi:hypothetical protein
MRVSASKAHHEDYLRQLLAQAPPGEQLPNDEVYLRVWELEQNNANTRWSNTTFFLSTSFAIFGFSFQVGLASPMPLAARLIALGIYWFAYLLFRRFNRYTTLLRDYLRDLEQRGQTRILVQTHANRTLKDGPQQITSATQLLLYFGVMYTMSVPILWWLTP